MSLWQKLLGALGAKAAGFPPPTGGTYNLRDVEFVRWAAGATETYSGKAVDEAATLSIATAFACVRVLAEAVGSLSSDVYARDPATREQERIDHPIGDLFSVSPNADMTAVEYKEALITNLALTGNAYSYRGEASLYPIPSCYVEPGRDDKTGELYYKVWNRGKQDSVPRSEIWHVKGFGANGLIGYSPIACARQTLGVSLATEEFQARFFRQGASPSWILSIPQYLKAEARTELRANIPKLWQGLDNAHQALLLEGGMTATQATMPLEDAQFLQLRKLSRNEICGIFRVQPHLVMDLERSTNNNIEQQSLEFVMYSLAPYLARIEAAATRWLFKPSEQRTRILRFNVDSLLRADATTRAELHSKYVQNGIMTRNEVRAIERLSRSEQDGMDEFTVQVNLTAIEDLPGATAATTAPAPVAAPAAPSKALSVFAAKLAEAKAPPVAVAPPLLPPMIVNLNMPDSFKHVVSQAVELPAFDALAEQLRKTNERQEAMLVEMEERAASSLQFSERLAGNTIASVEALKTALSKLTAAYEAPREAVLTDGTVLRTRKPKAKELS